MSAFILMLTRDDRTVPNARSILRQLRGLTPRLVGFKDVGASFETLDGLTRDIQSSGAHAMLEVVSTTRADELASIEAAIALRVDYVLGGRHARLAAARLRGTNIRYFPFAGQTAGHPTRLLGDRDAIVEDARALCAIDGVDGVDLLAYRGEGDAEALTRAVIAAVDKPVIVAGSIDRPARIAAMRAAGAWAFTVGSALFEGAFTPHPLRSQVDAVRHLVESDA